MNPRIPDRNAARFPVAAHEGETPIAGFPCDLQDVSIVGVGEAIEFGRASLASIVSLYSCSVSVCKNTLGFSPVLAPLLDMMTKNFQCCLELQASWLNLLLPCTGRTIISGDPYIHAETQANVEEEESEEEAEDFIVETFENF